MMVYFAGAENWLEALYGMHDIGILVSYYYLNDKKVESIAKAARTYRWRVFLDSGAFSAYMKGVQIDIQAYIAFCQQYADVFDVISSLDVIRDWRKSRENFEYMRTHAVDCVPVFHVGSPFEELASLAKESDYVALGVAGNQSRQSAVYRWLIQCFKTIAGTGKNPRIHGFGLTSWKIMRDFDWTSVDSTSWVNAGRYGELFLHSPRGLERLRAVLPRHEKIRRLRRSLTVPDEPEQLLIPRLANSEQYYPAYRHNIQCFTDYVARLNAKRGLING